MKTLFYISDVAPDSIAGTMFRMDGDKIKSVKYRELPAAKFPRNMSLMNGMCLELEYHGSMFSVRGMSHEKFQETVITVQADIQVSSPMFGDTKEDAAAKLEQFIKDNINTMLASSGDVSVEVKVK